MSKKIKCKGADIIITAATNSVTTWQLFYAWLHIGFTSFGGGAVTSYLIQETFIYKQKWITNEEYTRLLGMCQIVPGINLLAITILIGKQIGGRMGVVVSLAGLFLPSAGITVAIAGIYTSISDFSRVQAALRAVFAAVFGISLATNWRNIKPIFVCNHKRGLAYLGIVFGIMIGSASIYIFLNPPVIALYFLGGLCGALTYWHGAKSVRRDQ